LGGGGAGIDGDVEAIPTKIECNVVFFVYRFAEMGKSRVPDADRGAMGTVIRLRPRAALPEPAHRPEVVFHFDLGCPFSYLAAERVERSLGEVLWQPIGVGGAVHPGAEPAGPRRLAGDLSAGADAWRAAAERRAAERRAAERRAAELRLPLSWPERVPVRPQRAHRVATLALELGVGSRFALAAARLAFCGGFDLDEEEVLLEAAAAAGLPASASRQAASDASRDRGLVAGGMRLRAAGICRLPAISVDGQWFVGERAPPHAALQTRARAS
jgi:2-hydroxychromene-2-carboxylate isomerase